jgi:hypothetical protein
MRGAAAAGWASQGLTLGEKRQMNLKLRGATREISERKQVGDAESMVNEGVSASGHHGFFKGEGGEV